MLPVEAGLDAVRAVEVREVVDHLRDVLLEIEAGVALASARQRRAESGDAGDRDRWSGAGVAVGHRALMPVRELRAELIQLARSDRRHHLAGNRIHGVEEIGGALERVDAAAAVVRRVVVEAEPADRRAVRPVQLVVGLRDEKLRRLHVRRGVGLRLQPDLLDD